MPKPAKKASAAVNTDLAKLTNVVLTPLGLDVTSPLTLAEWRDIGRRIAVAMRSAAFVIGIAAPAAMRDALRGWLVRARAPCIGSSMPRVATGR